MGEDNNRNLFIALGLVLVIMLVYQWLVLGPAAERQQAELAAQQALEEVASGTDGMQIPSAQAPSGMTRETALGSVERIRIDAPGIVGSLALEGARIDDISLRRHATSVEDDSPVALLNPRGSEGAFYVNDGWVGAIDGNDIDDLPGNLTQWQLVSGSTLTPDTPVVLEHESASGLHFRRQISIDENYLFTVQDTVTNGGSDAVALRRYGRVRHLGLPDDLVRNMASFEGAMAMIDGRLERRKFTDMDDLVDAPCIDRRNCSNETDQAEGTGGWVGITERYWMAAAIPEQGREILATFDGQERGEDDAYDAYYVEQPEVLAAGGTRVSTAYVFAGAKELDVLQHVQNDIGVMKFDMAINWGWLWFLVRPFVWALHMLEGLTGHFGLAILALTLVVKLIMFPLANRSYASMAKMKLVQPKMQEIRERYASDQQKQQQAMMDLYRKEKINPLAGCLPMLPTIPIFFALYQTLFNAIEMRHQPFFGWISDMSARDPLMIGNLFGLLPYDPLAVPVLGVVLGLGLWPIIMGITMAAQQALNPPPPDPTQAKIFAFLPVIFTFVLAGFPAGLVIYYAWNNALTVLQQYVIMRRHGNETQFDKLIAHLRGKLSGKDS